MWNIVEIIGNLSYIFTVLAFLVRDMLRLRILATFAGIAGIVYGLYSAETPLWTIIIWETIFAIVNLIQIGILIHERRHLSFTEEERGVYQQFFSNLTQVEFKKLLKIGTFLDAEKGEMLTEQGKEVLRIIFIVRGSVKIEKDSEVVAFRRDGSLIGEMSFISGQPATATVITMEKTRFIMWLQEDLRALLHQEQTMESAMQTIFNKDLIDKLLRPTDVSGNQMPFRSQA